MKEKTLIYMSKNIKRCIVFTIIALCTISLIGLNYGQTAQGATSVTLSKAAQTETTITLSWTKSNDVLFSSYALYLSTTGTNGPFTQIWSTTSKDQTTTYIYGLEPSTSYWFYIADSGSLVGTSNSNTLEAATNPNPTIAITSKTTTTASLQWSVYNSYSTLVPFKNYVIQMSTDSGPWATLTTITDVSQNTYMVTGLSPATYGFRLIDNSGNFSATSNTEQLVIHKPVEAQINQPSITSINLGQQIQLSAQASGGTGSFNYQWYANNEIVQSGPSSTLSFNPSYAGSYNVKCIVTDTQDTLLSPATTSTIALSVTEIIPTMQPEQTTNIIPTQTSTQNQQNNNQNNNEEATNNPINQNNSNQGLPTSYIIIIVVIIVVLIGIIAVFSIKQKSAKKLST
jgi:hypothetical protein